jgi:hypothetical protein
MIARWLTVVLCFLLLVGISAALGCSVERNRYRTDSMRTDLDHLVDDVDWALGIDEPSILYEDSFPPHP